MARFRRKQDNAHKYQKIMQHYSTLDLKCHLKEQSLKTAIIQSLMILCNTKNVVIRTVLSGFNYSEDYLKEQRNSVHFSQWLSRVFPALCDLLCKVETMMG